MSSSRKRKSDAAQDAPEHVASKKARLLVDGILSDASNYPLPNNDDLVRSSFVELAKYARSLEEKINANQPKEKSPEDLEAAA